MIVIIIAWYLFLQIQVIDSIDSDIYRTTEWSEGLVSFGLSIKNVSFLVN